MPSPRSTLVVALLAIASLTACDAATTAEAEPADGPRTIEVCATGCDVATLDAALAEARDGDTVHLVAGQYEGGVSITTSITLVGDGQERTRIYGGGPVVTVGTYDATTQPTVTIEGVAISGGLTTSSPEADLAGLPGVQAYGGGISIPPGHNFALGATVTLRDVVVEDNHVTTTAVEEFDDATVGTIASSVAAGGGIDSWGDLTLERTVVRDNLVGAPSGLLVSPGSFDGEASDADGGGIMHHQGDLTIDESEIRGNLASVAAPNGRYAEGGGLYMESGVLVLTDSVVAGNRAELHTAFPEGVEASAMGGGILLHGGVARATIDRTRIEGNAAIMTNSSGPADASAGGLNAVPGVAVTIDASTISGNWVRARTVEGSRGTATAAVGGGALPGTITDTVIEGNSARATSRAGDASAAVGGVVVLGTLDGCEVRENWVQADATKGTVTAFAGGLWVAEEPLTVRDSVIEGNEADANGHDGWARGGGIYAGPSEWGTSDLTLIDSRIVGNRLRGGLGTRAEGGGLYREGAGLRLRRTTFERNDPEDCVGCP